MAGRQRSLAQQQMEERWARHGRRATLFPLHDVTSESLAAKRAVDSRAAFTSHDILTLQRMVGNQAVQRVLAQRDMATANPESNLAAQPSPNVTRGRGKRQAGSIVVSKSGANRSSGKIQRTGVGHIQRAGRWAALKNYFSRERLPKSTNVAWQGGKPLAAMSVSGATTGITEAASSAPAGIPAGMGALNFLTAADAGLSIKSGYGRYAKAKESGDQAGMTLGKDKALHAGTDLAGGLAGTTQAGLNIATVAKYGSEGLMTADKLVSGANYASTGLGVAGAAAGIAGGSVTAAQGLWKIGKAASRLRKLGNSKKMLTEDGDRWRARLKNREKTKVALNSLKVIGGGLGIAAGALAIASNPVGWALGIAAAATVGGLAAYKFYTKWKKAKRKRVAKLAERAKMNAEESATSELPDEASAGLEENVQEGGGEEGASEGAALKDADTGNLDPAKRKEATELGNRVAQNSSKSAKIAGEMLSALPYHKTENFADMLHFLETGIWTQDQIRDLPTNYLILDTTRKAHDALVMLDVLNVKESEAESPSAQELIEKKLSATGTL